MDLNELKENWKNVNERLSKLEAREEKLTRLSCELYHRKRTAQEKLISQYSRLRVVLGLFGVLYLSFGLYWALTTGGMQLSDGLVFPWWILALIGLFCFAAAIFDGYLSREVSRIDLGTMSVMDVSRIATRCRRLHHLWMVYAIPAAVVLVSLMFWSMQGNEAAVIGGIAGGVAGLACGLVIYLRIMKNYRRLMRPDDIPLE